MQLSYEALSLVGYWYDPFSSTGSQLVKLENKKGHYTGLLLQTVPYLDISFLYPFTTRQSNLGLLSFFRCELKSNLCG